LAGAFFAVVVFFVVLFLAVEVELAFLAGELVVFLAVLFLAVLFFAGELDELVFFAVLFFAVVFLAVEVELVFFAGVDFLAVLFLAVEVELVFFAGLFFAVLLRADELLDEEPPAAEDARPAALLATAAVLRIAGFAAPGVAIAAAANVSFGSFFAPETTFFRSAPGLNLGTARFFVFTRSPVAGLRAQPAFLICRSNEPKPVMATFSPLATSRVMVSSTDSKACAAALRFPS
jgi:hypothetical protein